MTAPQLKAMLRWAIRYINLDNAVTASSFRNQRTRRIEPAAVRLTVAKTDQWLAKARKAVARPKPARKAK